MISKQVVVDNFIFNSTYNLQVFLLFCLGSLNTLINNLYLNSL